MFVNRVENCLKRENRKEEKLENDSEVTLNRVKA